MRRTTIIGLVLLVIGVPLGIALVIVAVGSTARRVERLQRIAPSGRAELTFDQPGSSTVYAETDHVVGKSSPQPPIAVSIASATGAGATSQPYDSHTTYNVSGHSGIAIATLDVPAAGTYVVTTTGSRPGDGVVDVALGDPVITATTFVLPLVAGILVLVGGLVAGILLIVLPGRARRDDGDVG